MKASLCLALALALAIGASAAPEYRSKCPVRGQTYSRGRCRCPAGQSACDGQVRWVGAGRVTGARSGSLAAPRRGGAAGGWGMRGGAARHQGGATSRARTPAS